MNDSQGIQRQYYAATAAAYDNMHVGSDDEHYVALRQISSFVDMIGISSILDVGCGTGRGAKYFLEKHPGMRVQGIEPVQALVEVAAQKDGALAKSLVRGEGEYLPFPDNSFEAVCEFGVLHHVPNPSIVVREMTRVASKAVFLSDSNRFGQGSLPARWAKLLLYKCGLWNGANLLKTKGKGYTITDGDGLAYSYSVFDSYSFLAKWAKRIVMVPTTRGNVRSWLHPLLTANHILLCAFRAEA